MYNRKQTKLWSLAKLKQCYNFYNKDIVSCTKVLNHYRPPTNHPLILFHNAVASMDDIVTTILHNQEGHIQFAEPEPGLD